MEVFILICLVIFIVILFFVCFLETPKSENNNNKDKEIIKTANKLFTYTYNLLQNNNNWDTLINSLKNGKLENNNLYWLVWFGQTAYSDFGFWANKKDDKFGLTISGSANGTTKKYFGFSLYIINPVLWGINLEDGYMGCTVSIKAKLLSKTIKKIILEKGLKAYTVTNGKLEHE